MSDIHVSLGICHLWSLEGTKISLRNVGVCSIMRNCVVHEWGERVPVSVRTSFTSAAREVPEPRRPLLPELATGLSLSSHSWASGPPS